MHRVFGVSQSSVTSRVSMVRRQDVPDLWPHCKGWVASALRFSDDDYTLEDIRALVFTGDAFLLVAHKPDGPLIGAAVVEIHVMPRRKILHVLAMGGRGICTKAGYGALRDIARGLGCRKVQGWAKLSQARLYRGLGMVAAFYVMRGDT